MEDIVKIYITLPHHYILKKEHIGTEIMLQFCLCQFLISHRKCQMPMRRHIGYWILSPWDQRYKQSYTAQMFLRCQSLIGQLASLVQLHILTIFLERIK